MTRDTQVRDDDMPTNILSADTGFPQLRGDQSDAEKFGEIENYLYMLLEQLRYALNNLGVENFNETSVQELSDLITEPVYMQLTDAEGRIQALTLTAQGLSQQITGLEGQVTTLTATADGLNARITTAEGEITTLSATAAGLNTRVTDAEGNLSELSQTVSGLSLGVQNAAGYSKIQLLSNGVVLATSGSITLGGNVVFTSDLTDGVTQISGSNIKTGSISAIDIDGSTITGSTFQTVMNYGGTNTGAVEMYYLSEAYLAGVLRLDDEGEGTNDARYRMFLKTYTVQGVDFGLKLEGAGGVSMESMGSSVYIAAADYIRIMLNENAGADAAIHIGNTGQAVKLYGGISMEGTNLYVAMSNYVTITVSGGLKTINIGGTGQTVNLNGTVKINGVTQ